MSLGLGGKNAGKQVLTLLYTHTRTHTRIWKKSLGRALLREQDDFRHDNLGYVCLSTTVHLSSPASSSPQSTVGRPASPREPPDRLSPRTLEKSERVFAAARHGMASTSCAAPLGRAGHRAVGSAARSRAGQTKAALQSASSRRESTHAGYSSAVQVAGGSNLEGARRAEHPSPGSRLRRAPVAAGASSTVHHLEGRANRVWSATRSLSTSAPARGEGGEPAVRVAALARSDPVLYGDIRPQPRSAYAALAHRVKLFSHNTDAATREHRLSLIARACTHPSFAGLLDRVRSVHGEEMADVGVGKGVVRSSPSAAGDSIGVSENIVDAQYMQIDAARHNAALSTLGNSLLGLVAAEYLHIRYPNLPNRILKAAVSAYVGSTTLSDVAAELGVTGQGVVRWDRQAKAPSSKAGLPPSKLASRDVHADALRAIVALIFQEQVRILSVAACVSLAVAFR